MWDLFKEGSVALVTGASRGIGSATAKELAANGVSVAVNYARRSEDAEDLCSQINAAGGKAIPLKADISSTEEVDAMFKAIRQEFGRLDILVNNAGIVDDGFVMQMSPEKFMKVIQTNLFGTYYATKNALYIMSSRKQNGGSIVNISSTSGVAGQEGQGNYSASKGGIIAFSKTIAREYVGKGIRCNVVAPGFIETDMTAGLSSDWRKYYMDKKDAGDHKE